MSDSTTTPGTLPNRHEELTDGQALAVTAGMVLMLTTVLCSIAAMVVAVINDEYLVAAAIFTPLPIPRFRFSRLLNTVAVLAIAVVAWHLGSNLTAGLLVVAAVSGAFVAPLSRVVPWIRAAAAKPPMIAAQPVLQRTERMLHHALLWPFTAVPVVLVFIGLDHGANRIVAALLLVAILVEALQEHASYRRAVARGIAAAPDGGLRLRDPAAHRARLEAMHPGKWLVDGVVELFRTRTDHEFAPSLAVGYTITVRVGDDDAILSGVIVDSTPRWIMADQSAWVTFSLIDPERWSAHAVSGPLPVMQGERRVGELRIDESRGVIRTG